MAVRLPWYRLRSPVVQNLISSSVLALTPGIYLALTAMGAGAGKPTSVIFNAKVNVILYSIFTFTSILAGPAVNIFGPKLCLAFGTTGYAVYVAGLWVLSSTGNLGFPLFSGAYLGVTAGFLWTSSGYTSQAYAPEKHKSRYIAQQWTIICLGSAMGSAIALGSNYGKSKAVGVQPGVYAAFIAIHVFAGVIALFFIVDPKTVQRSDGTYLAKFHKATLKEELEGIVEAFKNPRIAIFLFAAFTLDLWLPIIGSWNSYTFSLQARCLNSMLVYLLQIPSAWFFHFLVSTSLLKSRRKRILAVLGWVVIIQIAGWCAWLGWLSGRNRDRNIPGPGLDWSSNKSEWAKPFGVYIIIGLMAPTMRNFTLYMCSIASNDPSKQSRYAGILHAFPQAGLAVSFGIDSTKVPYLWEGTGFFIATMLSLGLAFVGVWKYTGETLYGTEEAVVVPIEAAKALGLGLGSDSTMPDGMPAESVGEKEPAKSEMTSVRIAAA
nr:uncharacterized protein CI109_002167 [Kwoniella shandongensis]KAA5529276.1 hypothetical protein CI109_002167 [Kwoniella shandongensis]